MSKVHENLRGALKRARSTFDPVKRQFTDYVPDTSPRDRTGFVMRQSQESYDASAAKATGAVEDYFHADYMMVYL